MPGSCNFWLLPTHMHSSGHDWLKQACLILAVPQATRKLLRVNCFEALCSTSYNLICSDMV